ncbi:hypothetical protein [Chitinophaga tropicalis]|uniref:Uncharacterized protein n=1 Tax=Chitinophaga tropicalis TaxID=2683588 RepID=A0A7K1U4P7_9BACT|nr:hypothetical protein [Chitinophaga tropicalis]MVT09331.1 hypothetical protein [Chitinophaga tropicalis]
MHAINLTLVFIVGLAALALLLFMIFKNRWDRKRYLPPDDPVQEQRDEQQRREEKM